MQGQGTLLRIDRSRAFLLTELLILFVALPPVLLLPAPRLVQITIVLLGLAYSLVIASRAGWWPHPGLWHWPARHAWKPVIKRFLLLGSSLTVLIAWLLPQLFLVVPRTTPDLWISVSLLYGVFSVIPQEWLFRHFLFQRYRSLVHHAGVRQFIIAALFSWAHIIFLDPLVLALTFVGGWLFADTYRRSGSLPLVAVEHAAWGILIYTIGLGGLLAFPMP